MFLRKTLTEEWLLRVPFAHRGLWANDVGVPENSMAAFKRAMADGMGFELDVHLTCDGEVVVFHDDTLDRLCGRAGKVTLASLSELRALRLGNTNEAIPTMAEVLEETAGKVPIMIELKSFHDTEGFAPSFALESALCKLLSTYRGPIALQSFNPATVKYLLDARVPRPVGLIACDYLHSSDSLLFLNKLQRFMLTNVAPAWVCQPDFVSYDFQRLPKLGLSFAKTRFPLLSWGVFGEKDLLRSPGVVDNIIFERLTRQQIETVRGKWVLP